MIAFKLIQVGLPSSIWPLSIIVMAWSLMRPNHILKSSHYWSHDAQQQPHQRSPAQVASGYKHILWLRYDVWMWNITSCIRLPSLDQSEHAYLNISMSVMIKILHVALTNLLSGLMRTFTIMWMSWGGLT